MAERRNFFKGKVISAESASVVYPDGHRFDIDLVRHPGGACVLAIDADDRVILLHQWRPTIKRYVWEIPAGKLEPDENPFLCVQRELAEEAGLEARSWTKIAEFYSTVGFCDEKLHLYKATGLSVVKKNLEPHELIEVYRFTKDEVKAKIKSGEIDDSKTLIALTMWLLNL